MLHALVSIAGLDDLIYLCILLASLLLCQASICIASSYRRHFNGLLGLAIVILVNGWRSLFSVGCALVNVAILRWAPRRQVGACGLAFSFAYLLFCRGAYYVGLPACSSHANAVQLILTLRCAGLAFELGDTRARDSDGGGKSITRLLPEPPSALDAALYYYNFVGLFTGPYYTYRVHYDAMRADCGRLRRIAVAGELVPRLCKVPAFIALMVALDRLYPLAALHTAHFYASHSLPYRFLYMMPVFAHLRMRVYTAWTLAECCCVAGRIGAYPLREGETVAVGRGPSGDHAAEPPPADDERTVYSFETVRNIDVYETELSVGFRGGMRAWNRSVQYWLATFVYKRVGGVYRLPLTMLASAYWHGLHAGYYMSFLTIPLCTFAEDMVFAVWRVDPTKPADRCGIKPWQRVVWWLVRTRCFEYMACGFLLLSYTSTMGYWSSIYFLPHWLVIAAALCAVLVERRGRGGKVKSS